MLVKSLEHGKFLKAHWEKLWKKDGTRFFSFDTENTAFPPFQSQDALIPQRARTILFSMCYRGAAYSFPSSDFSSKFPWAEDWGNLFRDWFLDGSIIKVMHNANYDLNILHYSMEVPVVRNIWCSMISAWKASEWRSKSLKERSISYGRVLRETLTVSFSNLQELAFYAEEDVRATDELFQMQYFGKVTRTPTVLLVTPLGSCVPSREVLPSGKIEVPSDNLTLFDKTWLRLLEFPLLRATVRAERRGFPFDIPRLRSIRTVINKELRESLKCMFRIAERVINLNSSKDLEEVFSRLEIDNPSLTKKTQKMAFDARTLNRLKGKHPFVDGLIKYRALVKLVGTYVGKREPGPDYDPDSGYEYFVNRTTGAIHCTLNTVGAVTGRHSAQSPNLQQVPTRKDTFKIRNCFVACPKGLSLIPRYRRPKVLLDLDYAQLEIRVMALYCKDRAMIKTLCDPKGDIHQYTADEFGVPRSPHAKNLNFLLLYGGQSFMLAEMLSFFDVPTSVSQADAYIKRHMQVYPRISEFRKELLAEYRSTGSVKMFLGRRRRLSPDDPKERVDWADERSVHRAETTLSNNVVQGAGQDFLKASIVRSDWRCINPDREFLKRVNCKVDHKAYLRDKASTLERLRRILRLAECNYILQVHDEALYTVRPEAAEECLNILADIMSWRHYFPSISSYAVPLIAEGGGGNSWLEAKSDKALFHVKTGFDEWKRYKE